MDMEKYKRLNLDDFPIVIEALKECARPRESHLAVITKQGIENRMIAKWIGWDDSVKLPRFTFWLSVEWVPTEVECMALLPLLVERGYVYRLFNYGIENYEFIIFKDDKAVASGKGETISTSILLSIFELIKDQ
jgi:hypothetical protein